MVARDPHGKTLFTSVQAPLGKALYDHYGLDPVAFDTFLVVKDGHPFTQWRGICAAAQTMPLPWRLLGFAGQVVPNMLGNVVYQFVQRNRISWFGKTQQCMIPSKEQRARFV
jgi:predicted DCC family thiol-disulfide oxidoreductase YuxK